ncbi:MAG: hypothetical protein RL662_867 [Bacteroidota bacterium]
MKKIVMIAFVAAATLSFVACNSKTDGANKENVDTTKVETPAPVDTTATAAVSNLDKYAVIVEKVIALQDKAKKGDAEAVKELANLGKEVAEISALLQKETATMTAEQTAKFTELAKKLADAATAK